MFLLDRGDLDGERKALRHRGRHVQIGHYLNEYSTSIPNSEL